MHSSFANSPSSAAAKMIRVRATPKSRKPRVEPQLDGSLRVYVSEAPERGRANEAVLAAVARFLGVPQIRVELVSGASSREKLFRIHPSF